MQKQLLDIGSAKLQAPHELGQNCLESLASDVYLAEELGQTTGGSGGYAVRYLTTLAYPSDLLSLLRSAAFDGSPGRILRRHADCNSAASSLTMVCLS